MGTTQARICSACTARRHDLQSDLELVRRCLVNLKLLDSRLGPAHRGAYGSESSQAKRQVRRVDQSAL